MDIINIYCLSYQRNGVAGEPFYTALIKFKDKEQTFDNMLVTFRTEDADKSIDESSCRAVLLSDIPSKWRGDEIAYMLQRYLAVEMDKTGGTIYDHQTNQLTT